jgi:hypothetical protein
LFVGISLAAAATAHVAPDAAARILIANFSSAPGQIFTDVYAASEFAAPLLMAPFAVAAVLLSIRVWTAATLSSDRLD